MRLHHIPSLREFDLGASETVVVCEGGAGCLLAVGAVAEDGAFVGACDGVLDGLTEAGT